MSRKGTKKTRKNKKSAKQTTTKIVYRDPPKPKNTVLGDLGAMAGNAVSKFFGLGSYTLKENSIVDAWNKQVPFMHSTNEKIIFRHREFITDINGSTAFSAREFNINPGLEETFPYLAQIAANFEEYKFRGLVLEYKSTSAVAVNSTNTALGTVVMAAQYRADSPSYINKMQMESSMWAATTTPSENVFLPIECAPAEMPMRSGYIRSGALTTGQDIKFYDLAKVTLATVGMQATSTIGELWATYEVELSKPVMNSQGGGLSESLLLFSTAGITSASVLGTNATKYCDTIGVAVGATGQTITFPAGLYGTFRGSLIVKGTSAALGTSFTVTRVNNVAVNAYPLAGTPNVTHYNISSGTSDTQMVNFAFSITDPGSPSSITFSTVSIPTAPIWTQLEIEQVPSTYPLGPTN
nr:structural protein [Tolivirales sp.]